MTTHTDDDVLARPDQLEELSSAIATAKRQAP